MATATPNTPFHLNEASTMSSLAEAFAAFLPVFETFISAERDLEEVNGYDPAYNMWLRDAERAQDDLIDAMHGLRQMSARSPQDRAIRHMVHVIDTMRGAAEPGVFRRTHRHMHASFFTLFQARGFDAAASKTNTLLLRARHLVDAMAELPLFDRDDGDDAGVAFADDLNPGGMAA